MDDGSARIELRRRSGPSMWAVVDLADLERVQERRWRALVGKWTTYAVSGLTIEGRRTAIYLHRFILEAPHGLQVDHVDHDGLNNRRSNLRLATESQNMGNARNTRRGSSRFKGVCWDSGRQRWHTSIKVARRQIFLGRYASEEEAAIAYDNAALEMFGEFACLNLPSQGAA